MTLVGYESAPGSLIVGNGDRFVFASATPVTENTVIGYAIFEVAKGASFDTSKVSFAMDGAAYDVDLNPTTARFNDAEVTRVAIPGDVNIDGQVDIRDAVLVLKYIAAADINGDGDINVADAVAIMQMCVA